MIDRIYSIPNLANMGLYCLLLVFFAFLCMIAQNSIEFVTLAVSTTVMLIEIFLMSYIGQRVQDDVSTEFRFTAEFKLTFCHFLLTLFIFKSINIAHQLYHLKWYNRDNTYKKGMILMLKRSQSPSCLTAFKFRNIDIQTFSDVLKLAYKILAVLRN